jgi:pyruvate kinase
MFLRTKIICTMGPATKSFEKIMELIDAGMNVARLNFSHGTYSEHLETIHALKKAREKSKKPLGILLDTKGPEIRIRKIKGDLLKLKPKDRLFLVERFSRRENELIVDPFSVLSCVEVGMNLLFDDGYIQSKVVEKRKKEIIVEILNEGILRTGKKVNIPDAILNLPALTEKDIEDLKFGCKHGIDLVAASFVRSAEHLLAIKNLLEKESSYEIPVIAKIENKEGIVNFDAIVEVADGIMVARGDLGVEVDLSLVPRLQKMMIQKSTLACKPVVTATQMLESMIQNPRPTRAEASDVANAIYDSTSSVMLSAETSVGKYPVQAVLQMRNIIRETEGDFDYLSFFDRESKGDYYDVSSSVAIAAVKTAYSSRAKAIFVFTNSGFTARLVSRLRPEVPIVALTTNEKIFHQLSFLWGVVPMHSKTCRDADEAFAMMSRFALQEELVAFGDLIVVTAGVPFNKKGSTNLMMVESIGHILVRGYSGVGREVEGKVTIVRFAEEKTPKSVRGKILVIPRCDGNYIPLMCSAAGVILQNNMGDTCSEKFALATANNFHLSLIVRADNAMSLLKEKQSVVLDPQRGLVYSGAN